jgi:mannose-6-phosphate isomerase
VLTRLKAIQVEKPWGRTDVPELFGGRPGRRLGEIWFQREDGAADALLIKYLFTSERLSVQVHPDDATARAAGHARGKDEAWVILAAEPGAAIGIGLMEPLSAAALRQAAEDGSIADRLDWRPAAKGDVYYSPAGTIHSIGAGLTLLEVQQNSDVTYRLYDFGRPRELHLENGVAAAKPDLRIDKSWEHAIDPDRSVIAQGGKFTLERWTGSARELAAHEAHPVWLMPMRGTVTAGTTDLEPGSVWIADSPTTLELCSGGELLLAYEGDGVRG